ncbi:hydroxylysine kinase-like [Balamuthia mandrillaris]
MRPELTSEQAKAVLAQYYGHLLRGPLQQPQPQPQQQAKETSMTSASSQEIGEEAVKQVKELKSLPSYDDQNFYVRLGYLRAGEEQEDEEYVLKVSHSKEEEGLLSLQAAILRRLEERGVSCPSLILTDEGNELTTIASSSSFLSSSSLEETSSSSPECRQKLGGEDETFMVRMLRFVPGKMLRSVQHTPPLLRSVGSSLATVDKALEGLTHASMKRDDLVWDLRNGALLRSRLHALHTAHPIRLELVKATLDEFEEHIAPTLHRFSSGIVHNDANSLNVVVSDDGSAVKAIIDYGDACHTFHVCNLAIAMAYCMLFKEDEETKQQSCGEKAMEAGAFVLEGYNSVRELQEDEVRVLPTLIKLRLAISVTNSALSRMQHPNDDYVAIDERGAWHLLEVLSRRTATSLADDLWQFIR